MQLDEINNFRLELFYISISCVESIGKNIFLASVLMPEESVVRPSTFRFRTFKGNRTDSIHILHVYVPYTGYFRNLA